MKLREIVSDKSIDELIRGDVVKFNDRERTWGNLAVFYATDKYGPAFVTKIKDEIYLLQFRRSIIHPNNGKILVESRKSYRCNTRCPEDIDYEFYDSLFSKALDLVK